MEIFEAMAEQGHEQLNFFYDQASGLKLIVAVHDTTLGPATGGTRLWHYDQEADAVWDALRLSYGMTLKNAVSGLNFGGSKCVIYGDPKKSPELFHALGRFITALGGRVYTGEDVGITAQDVELMAEVCPYIVGREATSGDPSKAAAYGTYMAVRAVLMEVTGQASVKGRKILVQGVGNVGLELCRLLAGEGARLVVADINPERTDLAAKLYGARVVDGEALFQEEGDVLSPCALGQVLTAERVSTLRVRAIAGSANNQVATPEVPALLAARGILYAPDFVVNGGGVINIADEFLPGGYQPSRAMAAVARIYERLREVFRVAKEEQITTEQAAEQVALRRISAHRPGPYLPAQGA